MFLSVCLSSDLQTGDTAVSPAVDEDTAKAIAGMMRVRQLDELSGTWLTLRDAGAWWCRAFVLRV